MRLSRSKEVVTGLWATCVILNGGVALNYNNDAIRNESIAYVYDQQGNHELADAYDKNAGHDRGKRNLYLGLTALNLYLAVTNGAFVIIDRAKQREEALRLESLNQARKV